MAATSQITAADHGSGNHPDPATETFVAHRNLLFTVAYELLGSATDAEDAVQETWLRWARVDLGTVRDRRAYLVRIATRQALDRLRALDRRRESYVGPWLPEPLLTTPDVAEDVELTDSVSMAMLLVLQTLTPIERAVFVLHEVFALGYDEIAETVGKSPAAVRQLAYRARTHVARRRPRGAADQTPQAARARTRHALDAFRRAVETGDLHDLLDILAPDVVLLTDGGGVVRAAQSPIVGAGRVARILSRIATTTMPQPASVNGNPALIIRPGDETTSVVALRVDDGLVTELYVVRNPDKLAFIERRTSLCR